MLDYEISANEAADLLKDNKARLIDVREPWEFEAARIEGSVLMPMGDVPGRAHQELDPDERLVILCHHGQRSLNVAAWLRNQGYTVLRFWNNDITKNIDGVMEAVYAALHSSLSAEPVPLKHQRRRRRGPSHLPTPARDARRPSPCRGG